MSKKKKIKKKETQPIVYGYFPSFDYYAHTRHPLDDIFKTKKAYISHIRGFMSGIFECCSIIDMKNKYHGYCLDSQRGSFFIPKMGSHLLKAIGINPCCGSRQPAMAVLFNRKNGGSYGQSKAK